MNTKYLYAYGEAYPFAVVQTSLDSAASGVRIEELCLALNKCGRTYELSHSVIPTSCKQIREVYGDHAHECYQVANTKGILCALIISDLPRTHRYVSKPTEQARELSTDAATNRLVMSSIPAYRNSDICPVPGCTRQMYFKQCALVCDVHGFTDTRPPIRSRR